MNVSVEHLGPCKKLLRVELDAQDVEAERESVTHEWARHANLPGFRPGKAPRGMILRTFGSRIEEEVKRRLIPQAYAKAIEQQKLRPLAYPAIEEGESSAGQPLTFTARVETEPDFEMPDYKALPIRRDARVVTEEDVDRALVSLREQQATYVDLQRPVQTGDYVVVNYEGSCEGKPITDVSPTARGLTQQKGFWLHVEPDSFVPGFTTQLLGASAGEKRSVTVSFPADFVVRELAGKQGVYEVEIVQVKEKALPAVDDALARSLGAADLATLRAGVRRDLDNELKSKQKRQVRDQLVATLLGRVSCELPEDLVQNETRSAVFDIVRSNQERGIPKEAIDERKEEIYTVANNSAKERIKAMILLGRIAEKEGIKASQEEVTQRILQIATRHQIRPDKLVKQLKERGAIGQIQREIVETKVLDVLELYAAIEEGPLPA